MSATRLDWAAAHLGLDGDDKDTLRAILKSTWDDGYDRAEEDHDGTGFWVRGKRGNPYEKEPTT